MVYGLPVLGHGGPHAGTYKVCPARAGPRPVSPSIPPTRPRSPATTPANWRSSTSAVARLLPALDPAAGGHGALRLRQLGRHRFRARPGGHMSSSGAAPAGTPSSSGRCWASCWPTWPRTVDRPSISPASACAAARRRPTGHPPPPVGCGGAPLRRPAPQRQRRRPRPPRHERAACLLRGPRLHRRDDVHPDGERPLHDGVQEREGHRRRHRAASGRRLRRLAGRPRPERRRPPARRLLEPLRQGGGRPGAPPRHVPGHGPDARPP